MKYIELKNKLKNYLVFSINDIRKIEPGFHLRRLSEWQNKGYIKKIINKYYIFVDSEIDEKVLFVMAGRIYSPSYVSLETALSWYGLIPESVYSVTSVSSRRTYSFKTKDARFIYQRIKPSLMFGYSKDSHKEMPYKIADAEKALIDFLYLNPGIKTKDDFRGLRINRENFKKAVKMEKLKVYLKKYRNKSLGKRVLALADEVNRH